ncbi:MAG TPA: helix-turn-helix domain-containing protein [Bryobacteraceae bacterium]|nr:helix-turn-helix domain-containing protein [Bryobacteraceae bacterium]
MRYKQSEKMAQRKQARRRRLLGTAIALFGRVGYHAATVPMLVAEADTSTGAFYLYFRNKEDVYVAALEEIGVRLAAALNEEAARETRPERKMGVVVKGFVRWLAGNPAEARMLVEAAALGGRMEEARRTIIESHVRSVAAALEHLAPWFDAQERAVVARCWTGSVLEAALGWLALDAEKRPEAERLGTIVAGYNLRGAALEQ